jgi:DNA processing protein
LCESAEDILCEFEYLFPSSNRPEVLRDAPDLPAFALSPNEAALYALIDKEEMSIDDLIRRSGLAPSAVSVTLPGLEMKRLIRQMPGKIFVKND